MAVEAKTDTGGCLDIMGREVVNVEIVKTEEVDSKSIELDGELGIVGRT